MSHAYESFQERAHLAAALMRELRRQNKSNMVLAPKPDTHVFRPKLKKSESLSLRHFTRVIHVDLEQGWVDVEGMISYNDLVAHLVPLGRLPKIIPELRSITVGGAISGVGVEATSFKYGLVHETILEMDVLTAAGDIVTCTKDGPNRDLFLGMPNSYGVLGYILRARVEIMKAAPYVEVRHERYTDSAAALRALEAHSNDQSHDFVEGVAYAKNDIRLLLGKLVASAPPGQRHRDFRIKNAFYRTVRDEFGDVEYMSLYDYLWRWDADAYWATEGSVLDNSWLRRLLGEGVLRSDRLLKLLEHPLSKLVQRGLGKKLEVDHKLTQDIGIPARNWQRYFDWYCDALDKFPMWLCTTKARPVPLFQTGADALYCDFGSFSAVFPDQQTCRRALHDVEQKMLELDGVKCFYSDNALAEADFYRIVDKDAYRSLKAKYDPSGLLPDLYEKCVKVCGPSAVVEPEAVRRSA